LEIDFKNYGDYIELVVDNGVCTINRNISEDGIKILNDTALKSANKNRVNNGKQVLVDSVECYNAFRGSSGCCSFG